jgi:hypothetical protein
MERSKWKRSQSVRWDERRLVAYSEYAAAVKTLITIAWRIGAARGLPSIGAPLGVEEGLPLLADAEATRGAKWETVQLLGDPDTVNAARRWHMCAWKLNRFARGELAGADEFLATYSEAGTARDHFYRAARASLNVGAGELPVGPPPALL